MSVPELQETPEASLYLETYGCQMNEYDSGLVRGILGDVGYSVAASPEEANVILINTCAIREKAHERVYGRLAALAHLKRRDPRTVIGVLGCMAQNLGDDLFAQGLPVDFVMGPDNYRDLPEMVSSIREGRSVGANITTLSRTETYEDLRPGVVSGPLAFVTIMRGCDNFCSFCVVPYTRGRERSRSPSSIVSETNLLIEQHGIREVTLLGQNVNSYRHNTEDSTYYFRDLVRMLLDETSISRVRFTSPHPHDFPEDLLQLMAAEPRFCSHIHLPLQSGSSSVLERMRRDYDREGFLNLVDQIRSRIPEVGLSTDVIVGFCGETDAEFQDTLSAMQIVEFDMAFMFRYSEREGTYARKTMPDDVPDEAKGQRLQELIDLQTSISREKNARLAASGIEYEILVEGPSKRSSAELVGRSDTNKVVVFPAAEGIGVGDMVRVRVNNSTQATLRGELAVNAVSAL